MSYQNSGSFRDLVTDENVFLAPVLKWNISPRTQATLEMSICMITPAWIHNSCRSSTINLSISRIAGTYRSAIHSRYSCSDRSDIEISRGYEHR